MAIDLSFTARARPATHGALHVLIRNRKINALAQENPGLYEEYWFDLARKQEYTKERDYLRSSLNVLRRHGISIPAADLVLDSTIPIGKGMCSSSTMILAFIKALLALSNAPELQDARCVAELAWEAEVLEFNEPGGRMDHYISAHGGLLHLDFSGSNVAIEPLTFRPSGCFLLFDTLEPKDTLQALSGAKQPTLAALATLQKHGIQHLRDLSIAPCREILLEQLPPILSRALCANLVNLELFDAALALLRKTAGDDQRLGALLTAHHRQLADGLNLSTPKIEQILTTALASGAWGGKLTGSGGGGCLFVYAPAEVADDILTSIARLGYPGKKVHGVDRSFTMRG